LARAVLAQMAGEGRSAAHAGPVDSVGGRLRRSAEDSAAAPRFSVCV
jgi:hypothetical protein